MWCSGWTLGQGSRWLLCMGYGLLSAFLGSNVWQEADSCAVSGWGVHRAGRGDLRTLLTLQEGLTRRPLVMGLVAKWL